MLKIMQNVFLAMMSMKPLLACFIAAFLLTSCSSKRELEELAAKDIAVISVGVACSFDPKADVCAVYEGLLASCKRDKYGRVHECSSNIVAKIAGVKSIDLYWQKYDPSGEYFTGPDLKGFLGGCVNVLGMDRCYDAAMNPYYGGLARHASWGQSFKNLVEIPLIFFLRSSDGL